MSDASKYASFIIAVKHSKMICLSSFKTPPHLGQRLCLIFSLLSSAAFAQSPFFEITQKPAQVAVTTAHPMATEAALKMLQQGGSAIDAAIAAQLMLGLVESQSSGLGGGAFLMHWDAAQKSLTSLDGLAISPQKTTASLTTDVDGSQLPYESMSRGGRSAGVPGTLPLLAKAHAKFGKLPWPALFVPAIEAASKGFPMPAYMHQILSVPTAAKDHPDMLALYFDDAQKVKPVGTLIANPDYAKTLQRIALKGPSAIWADGASTEFLAAAQKGYKPSLMTEEDLKSYPVEEREPLCGPYLRYRVCVMAPPSFGGVVVLQVLQMLAEKSNLGTDFNQPEFAHAFAEAGKLAQVDRRLYVSDPAFFKVPAKALVNPAYVKQRAALIQTNTLPSYAPGQPEAMLAEASGQSMAQAAAAPSSDATSQLAVVDAQGNAVSMSTTNNLNFGSRILVQGYVLNNAMTNFITSPKPGEVAPNKMEPRKRPISSMVPTMVFDEAGQLVTLGGSGGGGQIVDYVAANLIRMLANQLSPFEALAQGHISTAIPNRVQLEKGTSAAQLADALLAKGQKVEIVDMKSGMGFLKRAGNGWIGSADPRRDGVAWGFNPKP